MTSVLLADADLSVRAAMALLLRHKLGVREIVEIGDAGQIEACLDRFTPDLILIDWDLPGLEAAPLCAHISASGARPVVIAMSIQAENEPLALACGARAFLHKRASGEHALNLFRRHLALE